MANALSELSNFGENVEDSFSHLLAGTSARIRRNHRDRVTQYMRRRRRLLARQNLLVLCLTPTNGQRSVWCEPRDKWWSRTGVVNVAVWPSKKFMEDLRMSKETFFLLCAELAPMIAKKHTNFRKPVSVENRLAITIWRLATNVEYRTLGNLFGIGTSTAGSIVREVCSVIATHLLPKYVKFPKGQAFQDVLTGFEEEWGFPHCAGAIDGSHIPIIAPVEDHCDYFNRKGWHSLILQAVVDYRYLFLDVNVGWSGSVHDARVLANSSVYAKCQDGTCYDQVKRSIGGVEMSPFIIGDAAYPLMPWLMKAFPESQSTDAEVKHFNYRLCRARIVVENAFGRLKGRFRLLKKQCDCDISTTVDMVSAAVTLHNYCELRRDAFDTRWLDELEDERPYLCQRVAIDGDETVNTADGKTIRHALLNHISNHPLN